MSILKIKPTLTLLISTVFLSASDQIPAPAQDHPVLLKGGIIHTVSGDILANYDLLLDGGKISNIEKNIVPTPDMEVIRVGGKHIYPGFVAAISTIGMTEVSAVRASVDYAETGNLNPNVRANVAYNPDSELIPVARSNGVLIANVTPQSGLIPGQSSLMMLDGWTYENAILNHPTALHINWPSMGIDTGKDADPADEQIANRQKKLEELDNLISDARAYAGLERNPGKKASQKHDHDLRFESMIPFVLGEKPIFIRANDVRQIEAAVHWADRQELDAVIVGGKDSWRTLNLLKQKKIPVVLESTLSLPARRFEDYDQPFKTPYMLYNAGVEFCIGGSGRYGASFQRNLPYHAAMAAAFGLPVNEAVKSITLNAAKILGLGEQIGSIEIGKEATLFIADGDPLDLRTQILQCFIQGKKIDMSDRHKMLYEKYRTKYKQLKLLK